MYLFIGPSHTLSLKVFVMFLKKCSYILFFCFLLLPNIASAYSEKDIVETVSFVEDVCLSSSYQEVATSTGGLLATSTVEKCDQWAPQNKIDIYYKGAKSYYDKTTRYQKTEKLDSGNYRATAYTKPKFIKENGVWYEIRKDTKTSAEYVDFLKQANFGILPAFGQGTFSTSSHSSSESAYMAQDNVVGYDNAHDATSSSINYITNAKHNALHNSFIGGTYYIRRMRLSFPVSFPADNDILSCKLRIKTDSTSGADTDGENILAFNGTDNLDMNTPPISEDFDDIASSSIGSQDLTTFHNAGDYVDFELDNCDFIQNGTSTVDLRLSGDHNDITPSGSNLLRLDLRYDDLELVYEYGKAPVPVSTVVRIDEIICYATTSPTGNFVLTTCQAPIIIWVVILIFILGIVWILIKFKLI